MRKIISFTHATLDGYIDDPHEWSFQYSDEELQHYLFEMTLAADALLLGRITYEGMAQAWPTRGGNPFADHVNSITKYVVASQPVDTTAWDPAVVIAGPDLLDEVGRLDAGRRRRPPHLGDRPADRRPRRGRPVDEYRICTSVIKGGGEPLFSPRQHRDRRAPRHQGLCHRRRRPRLPPRLSPLTRLREARVPPLHALADVGEPRLDQLVEVARGEHEELVVEHRLVHDVGDLGGWRAVGDHARGTPSTSGCRPTGRPCPRGGCARSRRSAC